MKDQRGFQVLGGVQDASGKPPNRPAVNIRGMTVDTAEVMSFRLYQDGTGVTSAVTDNGKGLTPLRPERRLTRHAFGLRGMQERAAFLGGHFSIVGTPGVGTTACVSMPMTEEIAS